ncbi:MAG: hypothetical protein QM765_01410 [Myxococcales bacterium]
MQAESAMVRMANLEQAVSCALQHGAATAQFVEDLTADLAQLVEELQAGAVPSQMPCVDFDVDNMDDVEDDLEDDEDEFRRPPDDEIPF